MAVHKQSISFSDSSFAFARELVAAGEYPNVSAAVSGELAKAKAIRERDTRLLEAEVSRRLALPLEKWEPTGTLDGVTQGARSYLAQLERKHSR